MLYRLRLCRGPALELAGYTPRLYSPEACCAAARLAREAGYETFMEVSANGGKTWKAGAF